MHAVAVLVAVEASLAGVLYIAVGRDWPRTCVYLLAATAPLEVYRTTIRDLNPSLFRLSIAAAAVTVLLARVRARTRPAEWREWLTSDGAALIAGYVLLAGVVGASLVASDGEVFLGRRLLAVLVLGVLVIAVMGELARLTSARTIAMAIVVGSVLPVLAACWQVLAPHLGADPSLPLLSELPVTEGLEPARAETASLSLGNSTAAIRLKGTFVDPNHFGAYLVFVALIALALAAPWLRRKRADRALALAALAGAAVIVLVATYSRSAWAAFALAVGVGLALLAPTIRRGIPFGRLALAGAIVLLAVIGATAVFAPRVFERVTPGSPLNAESNLLHESNARAGLDAFRSRPVLGIGAGRLGTGLNQGVRTSAADSTYITVAAELGVAGLFVLVLGAAIALQALWWRYRISVGADRDLSIAALAAYAGFLLANVFYDQLWWRDFHFVVLGLVFALSVQAQRDTGAARVPAR